MVNIGFGFVPGSHYHIIQVFGYSGGSIYFLLLSFWVFSTGFLSVIDSGGGGWSARIFITKI